MTRLPTGTFTPAPRRASTSTMALAQGRIETLLMLRHGEQQLLSIVIPVAMLIVTAYIPILGENVSMHEIVPMILAIAITSSGFTGQAISLAFDRRYGALKRTGASGVPARIIILGKILGVLAMVLLQVAVILTVAAVLGWSTGVIGIVCGLLTLLIGVAGFTSLGLLVGGTLSAELVLGLANLLWIIMVGIVGFVLYSQGLTDVGWWNLVPSVALASGFAQAFAGTVPVFQLLVLSAWAMVAAAAAIKWFRFDS